LLLILCIKREQGDISLVCLAVADVAADVTRIQRLELSTVSGTSSELLNLFIRKYVTVTVGTHRMLVHLLGEKPSVKRMELFGAVPNHRPPLRHVRLR
jgi:hypothetical protein